jgi:glycosyltransferase involved in cell wall biosynthesis
MKILHITPSYEPAWHLGGVVRSLGQLCQGLAKLGHEVTVYATDSGRDCRLEVPVNQPVRLGEVSVHYFKTDFNLKFAYSRAFGVACRDTLKNFDLIHMTAFWCYPGIVGGHYARRYRIPYVISTAGTVRRTAMRHKSLKKWLYLYAFELRNLRGAAAIRCVTDMEQQQNAYLPIATPSFVVANGIESEEFAYLPDPQEARTALGLKENDFIGLFIGRLAPVKRLDLLVDAAGLAKQQGVKLTLVIAGPDWGEAQKLQAAARRWGIDQEVRFWGPVSPEVRNQLLAASNFLALTSEEESFGYAAVEALFAGRPVILSEGVGIFREIEREEAGLVVPLNAEAIAQAIGELFHARAKLKVLGENAYRCARRHFAVEGVARKMALAYEDILLGRRSPALSWADQAPQAVGH